MSIVCLHKEDRVSSRDTNFSGGPFWFFRVSSSLSVSFRKGITFPSNLPDISTLLFYYYVFLGVRDLCSRQLREHSRNPWRTRIVVIRNEVDSGIPQQKIPLMKASLRINTSLFRGNFIVKYSLTLTKMYLDRREKVSPL